MSENEYRELNEYLNELFLYLDYNFGPHIDNLKSICVLNYFCRQVLMKHDLYEEVSKNNLTFVDIYNLAREIIKTLNEKYLEDFDNLFKSGELDFSYNSEYFDSHFTHTPKHNYINMNRYYSYADVTVLVHEYFHYINGKGSKNTQNHFFLGEFFSIYFENYAIDYLIKSGIPKEEINYKQRMRTSYSRSCMFYDVETPLLAYKYFGTVGPDSADLFKKYDIVCISQKGFDYNCKNLLNWFKERKKDYEVRNFSFERDMYDLGAYYGEEICDYFLYFLGAMWAFYARDNCNVEDILYMNDHINDDGLTIYDCLKRMKIDFDDEDFLEKVTKSLQQYFRDYDIEKVKNV